MSKVIQMPDAKGPERKDHVAGGPQSTLAKPVFALPGDVTEERSGLARIERWLDLADTALAIAPRRKTA